MKNTILKKIRESLIKANVAERLANSVKFPEAIEIEKTKDRIVMKLSAKAIGMCENARSYSNMQSDDAAFEGWALLLYAHYAKSGDCNTIELDLTKDAYEQIENVYKKTKGKYTNTRLHHNRFLYRALRFSQQYKDWFVLSIGLQPYIKKFEIYLGKPGLVFTNNIPCDEKPSKIISNGDKIHENDVEDVFADLDWQKNQGATFCKKYGGKLYRQLPVCLFEGDKPINAKAIFTGKKSAIDLWSCNNRELNVFELKYNNKMMGIITELFFYTNYMRDMFCRGKAINFKCQLPKENEPRGYGQFAKASFTKVNGYMLYDKGKLHQAITNEVIDLMNKADFSDASAFTITYGKIEYKVLDRTIEV